MDCKYCKGECKRTFLPRCAICQRCHYVFDWVVDKKVCETCKREAKKAGLNVQELIPKRPPTNNEVR